MQNGKAIANRYKIVKNLFRVNKYIYAKIFDKYTLNTMFGLVYSYENEEPGQILKMLIEKFSMSESNKAPSLIFPSSHVKDDVRDKSVSIFFIEEQTVPLSSISGKLISKLSTGQLLKVTYDLMCSLHYLHSNNVVHGNISLDTCFLSKGKGKDLSLALNILDTSIFHEQILKSEESLFFRSQSQENGLKNSFKDDAQTVVYILAQLISRGKMFTKERYQLEWFNKVELTKWKSTQFFKELVLICPQEMEFLPEIFVIVKSLSRNQKPDYPKFIKKVYNKLKKHQSEAGCCGTMNSFREEQQSPMPSISKMTETTKKQTKVQSDQENDLLMNVDDEDEEQGLFAKYTKLEQTKCTTKSKGLWNQTVAEGSSD